MAADHLTSQNPSKFPQLSEETLNQGLEYMALQAAVIWAVHLLETGNPQGALATLRGQLRSEEK